MLIYLYNKTLKKGEINNKIVYKLIFITILLQAIYSGTGYLHNRYLANVKLNAYRVDYFSDYVLTQSLLEIVFPIFGLIYFLWIIKP